MVFKKKKKQLEPEDIDMTDEEDDEDLEEELEDEEEDKPFKKKKLKKAKVKPNKDEELGVWSLREQPTQTRTVFFNEETEETLDHEQVLLKILNNQDKMMREGFGIEEE